MGLATLGYGIYLAATTEIDLQNVEGLEVNGFTAIFNGLVDIAIGAMGFVAILKNKKSFAVTAKENIKRQIVERYGNNADELAKEFSLDIDNHQKKAQCCGFSGDPSDNLFLKTPWFKKVNANPSNKTLKERRLPDSCCLVAGPKCRESESLKEAREKKYVFEDDCLSKLNSSASLNMWLTIFQMLFAAIMQSLCIALMVKWLLDPSSSASE
uniref:Tetraspanin n=1 Tax=Macrostomum lignano TaxID=282301 RepID=A0A1I8I4I2_9PLAT